MHVRRSVAIRRSHPPSVTLSQRVHVFIHTRPTRSTSQYSNMLSIRTDPNFIELMERMQGPNVCVGTVCI